MTETKIISITPTELVDLISENVKTHLETFKNDLSNSQPQRKEFLSRKETAEFFGVSLVCIHSWMKSGIVTPYKCGNRTFFNRAELVQRLFNSNKVA